MSTRYLLLSGRYSTAEDIEAERAEAVSYDFSYKEPGWFSRLYRRFKNAFTPSIKEPSHRE